MPEEYTRKDLEYLFTEIKQDLKDIKAQTSKTNGRVSNLENWKWFISGGLAILGLIMIPILFKVLGV